MNQLKLAIDLDGVCVNFNAEFSRLCIEQGIQMPLFDTTDPPTWHYPEHFGGTAEQISAVWRQIKESDRFWQDLEAYAGVPETLQRLEALTNAGHEVYFLTLRSGVKAKRQSELWLQEFGLSNPTVLLTPLGKARLVHELGITHVIDDYPVLLREYCLHRSALKPYPKVYMLEREYNKVCKPLPLVAVATLGEFVDSALKDI